MKNKKIIALLVALALVQLIFPVSIIAYENSLMKTVVEKGEKYTLDYGQIIHMNKTYMYLDTEDLYRVEQRYALNDEDYRLSAGWLGGYSRLGIEKDENGKVHFYDADNLEEGATDYNRLEYTYNLFYLYFSDYEFVNPEFGLKELAELGMLLCEDESNPITSYEEFMYDGEEYIGMLYRMPLDGKITLCVYKDYAVISEFYIGDELVLRHK